MKTTTTADCWHLINALPHKHPIRLQYSAAIHVPGMPGRMRRKFTQRVLKWAAKQLYVRDTPKTAVNTAKREYIWTWFRLETHMQTTKAAVQSLSKSLNRCPRSNTPLPLP